MLSILLLSGCSKNSSPTASNSTKGSIGGNIVSREDGYAIANASVTLLPSGLQVYTNVSGDFRFSNLQPGTYQLRVEKPNVTYGVTTGEQLKAGDSLSSTYHVYTVLAGWNVQVKWPGQNALLGDLTLNSGGAATLISNGSRFDGTWDMTADNVHMNFGYEYSGNFLNSTMNGTVNDLNGHVGTWSASR